MMIRPFGLTRLGLTVVLASSFCLPVLAKSAGGKTGTIPAASLQQFFQAYAKAAIPCTLTASVPKDGKYGLFVAYNPSTGKSVTVAAIGGAGTITVTESGRTGPCMVAGGAATNTDVAGGIGSIMYYQANGANGDVFPTSAAEADALFVKLFGTGSLKSGQSLTNVFKGQYGKVSAYYWVGQETQTFSLVGGKPWTGKVSVVKGIGSVNGKLAGIYAAGAGASWTTYSK